MLENVSHVLWDWNGTLLNDVDVNLEVVNRMLEDRKLPAGIAKDFYLEHFRFPVIDFYHDVGFDFSEESFDHAAADYVMWYTRLFPDTVLYDGTLRTLNKLNDCGISQNIISATKQSNLIKQVEHFGIADCFDSILGVSDSRGEGKIHIAKRWSEEKGVSADSIIMIGDTVHDAEVAAELGCRCILIASGHQCRAMLERTGMTVIDSIDELT